MKRSPRITRRRFAGRAALALAAATGASRWLSGTAQAATEASMPAATMLSRPIGRTGERLPVVGMGSWQTFDVGEQRAQRAPLLEVLRELRAAGGTVLDSSPMYGRSERVLGDLTGQLGLRSQFWFATKIWTRGRAAGERQATQSMQALGVSRLDLLQVHNLLDWQQHVPTLHTLRTTGRLRYAGVTHYQASAHDELQRVLASQPAFDFLQVNYSLAEPDAEQRLLPFCRERGIAVLVNRPFAEGVLFERVRGKPVPAWAVAELGVQSWAQYFLKWILGNKAVTCAIPATARPEHVRDNCGAATGVLPDERQRARMAADLP